MTVELLWQKNNLLSEQLEPDDISDSITHLTFGSDFNQPLKPAHIPDSVTHLTFDFDLFMNTHELTL